MSYYKNGGGKTSLSVRLIGCYEETNGQLDGFCLVRMKAALTEGTPRALLDVLLGILLLCVGCPADMLSSSLHSFPKRIPIGAIFSNDTLQAQTAFRFEIEKHNNSTQSGFKLDKYEKIIDVGNGYVLSKAICSTMSKGIFALFGVTNATSLRTIESYMGTFQMPYVSPTGARIIDGDPPDFVLRMRPSYDEAMIDIIRHYKWPRMFYVYDSDEGLTRLQKLYDVANNERFQMEIDVARITDINDGYYVLRQMDARQDAGDHNIVLDLSSEQAQALIFRQIQNLGMNRMNYHYLLAGLSMDELDIDSFKHGGVNITGFRLVNPDDERVQIVQREWSRLNPNYWRGAGTDRKIKLEAALTMDAVSVIVRGLNNMLQIDPDVFRNTFRRGQVYNNGTRGINCRSDPPIPWKHGSGIMKSFRRVEFAGVTGWVSFDEYGLRKDYTLDILELSLDNEPTKVGVWSPKSGLVIKREPSRKQPKAKDEKKANKTRVVTSIYSSPYLMMKKKSEDGKPLVGNARYEGYCADLATEVGKIVGFDFIIQLVKDSKYGEKEKDGTWNGMVGELTRREADMAIAPLTISSMRERVIDFSKPFMSLGISIMIKKPEKQKPGVFSFMDPLSYEIWMCIIFAYLGVSIVLFLVSRFSPFEWQIEDSVNGPTFTNDFTILNSLWFSLAAFMQQGCDISPRSLSGRIVGSVWWFFTLIIISSYTANLAAFLTVERMLTPIESADDLAKQTEIHYGTLDAGSTKNFFKTSKIAVYERMWAFMNSADPPVFVNTTDEGVERVRSSKGKYAFLLESTMNDYYNQRKPCNTMKVGGNLDSKGYGIATPLGSDLREPISLSVLTLRESGLLQKLHKKWWYDKGECAPEGDSKGSTQSALTLSNVAGIFYILIGGLGLSMIISLLEFLWKSRVESRRRETTFGGAMRAKSRCSLRGGPERENGGVGSPDLPKSMSTVPIARSSAVSLV